ncbi:helix-turn-helix transcriptional regulator [Salmonella enterica subsp. enterica]|nr:helix-turn-helix transcriptional regulator [Salmonella enterica subsp. enterica]ECJ7251606.1 helix-turn-helix transcriptional regulator [Salmonella enterica subsp. enterica]
MMVIVITSCHLLFAGLELVWREGGISLELIHATTPESILKIKMSAGDAIIIIATESDLPTEGVRSQVMHWRLEHLMRTNALPRIPVFHITGDMRILIAGCYYNLTRSHLSCELVSIINEVMANSSSYENSIPEKISLTCRQKTILHATLAGMDVGEIAELLCISPGVVFSHRKTLIEKLGLRNRLELMLLKTEDFEGMRDYLF